MRAYLWSATWTSAGVSAPDLGLPSSQCASIGALYSSAGAGPAQVWSKWDRLTDTVTIPFEVSVRRTDRKLRSTAYKWLALRGPTSREA